MDKLPLSATQGQADQDCGFDPWWPSAVPSKTYVVCNGVLNTYGIYYIIPLFWISFAYEFKHRSTFVNWLNQSITSYALYVYIYLGCHILVLNNIKESNNIT